MAAVTYSQQIQAELDARGLKIGEVALRDPIVDDDLIAQYKDEPWAKDLTPQQVLEQLDRRDLRSGEISQIERKGKDFEGWTIKFGDSE